MKKLLLFVILLFLILIRLAGYSQNWIEQVHSADDLSQGNMFPRE